MSEDTKANQRHHRHAARHPASYSSKTVLDHYLSLSSQTNFFRGPITLFPGFSSSSSSEPFLSPSSDCCLQDTHIHTQSVICKCTHSSINSLNKLYLITSMITIVHSCRFMVVVKVVYECLVTEKNYVDAWLSKNMLVKM